MTFDPTSSKQCLIDFHEDILKEPARIVVDKMQKGRSLNSGDERILGLLEMLWVCIAGGKVEEEDD